MRKHLYIICDSILLIIISVIFLGFAVYYRENLLIIICFIISEAYFVPRIVKGLCLIVDIIVGSQKKHTVFMGVLNTDTLDFFKRVEYTNIYFDDDEMQKNYIAFEDAIKGTMNQGDKIEIEYYKYSRVVLRIEQSEDC